MKRWIHSATDIIDRSVLNEAIDFAKRFKGYSCDLNKKEIQIPLGKGTEPEDMMGENMLGKWYDDNGFNVSFKQGDVEYTTQDTWRNYRGWNREKGHKAYLRDRLIMIVNW